jgi:predicted nucleotidyltransferase
MSKLIDSLLEVGFLTGSQAFGTAKEDSDIDIVFSIDDSQKINELISGRDRTQSDYFSGYYVLDDDFKQINLIPVHPHEFLPWYLATKSMTATLKDSGIVDPIKKYSVFMGIVCLFKGTVKELGTLNEYNKLKDRIMGRHPADFIDTSAF